MASMQSIQRALDRRRPAGAARDPYTRALGAAAAVVTLAGLGIGLYVYSRWTPDTRPGQGGDEWAAGGSGRAGAEAGADGGQPTTSASKGKSTASAAAQARRGPRPTLSLSLPPSFDRSSAQALQHIHVLVASLAEHFLIHLILPDSPHGSASDEAGSTSIAIGALGAVFADVLDFDARRLLLYSTSAGRQAVSLALACDAHVEVSFSSASHLAAGSQSPTSGAEDAKKKLEHLQRTTGVVVLLVLPNPDNAAAPGSLPAVANPELDEVLSHFRKASFSRSVRIVDTRSNIAAGAPATTRQQWEKGAGAIVELRAKMKR